MKTFPSGFIEFLDRHAELRQLKDALQDDPDVSLRINTAKTGNVIIDDAQRVPWCTSGWYLNNRLPFTFDPALHQGVFYVQDASSMAIETVIRGLDIDAPVRYLDACAAPGGKTTTAIGVLPEGSFVVANEYDRKRASVLAENISKWGNPDVIVTQGDTNAFSGLVGLFDIVATDVPCSGEGMMRKEAAAIDQWSPQLINRCAGLQREIVRNVWPSIKPGGWLIYSTCTFNLEENEKNVQWIVENLGGIPTSIKALDLDKSITGGIDTNIPCYRFIPGKTRGEGLFLCLIHKPHGVIGLKKSHEKERCDIKPNKQACEVVRSRIIGEFDPIIKGDAIYALRSRYLDLYKRLSGCTNIMLAGIKVAEIKGKDFLPTQQLALSTCLNRNAFPNHEVNLDDALGFLRKESISLPESLATGYVLITYRNIPLGFVKNIGRRSNNLYPKDWRILSRQSVNDTRRISDLIRENNKQL